jgi:hypothetical protein
MYKVNDDLLEAGLKEALKAKVNQLESAIENGSKSIVEVAVNEYSQTREVARSFLVSTALYDEYLLEKSKELKQRFGIQIK